MSILQNIVDSPKKNTEFSKIFKNIFPPHAHGL